MTPGGKGVNLVHTFIIGGQQGIEELVFIPEFNSCEGFNTCFTAGSDKIGYGAAVIDIGKGKCLKTEGFGLIYQLLR